MNLEEAMQKIKIEVDSELKAFFAKKRKEAAHIHPSIVDLVDQVADITLRGGKRMRPFLAWVGYYAMPNAKFQMPNKIPEELLCAMVALELFQTFALIHDDIMDKDKERRGGPTIHARSGESIAILAGDLAFTWADEAMTLSSRAPSAVEGGHLMMLYQTMKEEVIYGQTLDVLGKDKDKADELKTAWYSVVRPLQIGSALRFAQGKLQVPDDVLGIWVDYGVSVGRLFQLRDDVLDGEIRQEAFEKQAKPLRERARTALGELKASEGTKQLLVDFVQFVQKRKS